jgi:hypothetical protein
MFFGFVFYIRLSEPFCITVRFLTLPNGLPSTFLRPKTFSTFLERFADLLRISSSDFALLSLHQGFRPHKVFTAHAMRPF